LAKLACRDSFVVQDLPSCLKSVTEIGAQALGVTRCGVWLHGAGQGGLVCASLYDGAAGGHSSGRSMAGQDFQDYLAAMSGDGRLLASSSAGAAAILARLGLSAVIQAPIQLRGETLGYVICGEIGTARNWTPDDLEFCIALAGFAALALAGEEHRRKHDILRKAEIRYRGLFETSLLGLFSATPDGRLLLVNAALARMFGWPDVASCLTSEPGLALLFHDAGQRDSCLDRLVRDGAVNEFDALLAKANGTTFWGALSLRVVEGEGAVATRLEGAVADVSVRFMREQHLKAALIHCSEELAERDRALSIATRARSMFLANVGLGLRAPLRGLSDRLAVIDDALLPAVVAETVAAARHDLSQLTRRLEESLDLAEDGGIDGEVFVEPVDLRKLLADIRAAADPVMRRSRGVLAVDDDGARGALMQTDAVKLRRLIFGLLEHACLRLAGGGTIDLGARAGSGEVTLWVEDPGPPLNAPALAALSAPPGRGGGRLASLRSLAEALGGEMAAANLGAGIRLSVRLPQDLRAFQSVGEGAAARPARRVSTVLLVDDDSAVHELLGEALSRDSYRLIHAFDEQQGFDLAAELSPDVVVLNVLSAGLDGWGLLARLKSSEAARHLPVVMLTLAAGAAEAGYLLRASDFITKPFRFEVLLETVNRYRIPGAESVALVIEDDGVTRTILCRLLERAGWIVDAAANAYEGLRCLDRRRPAMVLLDLMMPGMDGFEFLKVMRLTERSARPVPVVVVTAKDLTDNERAWLAGTTRMIVDRESVSRSQMLDAVRDWVTHATARGTVVV
jgi:PAS domain S-box-containing protein